MELKNITRDILSVLIILALIVDTQLAFAYSIGEMDKPIIKAASTLFIHDDVEAHSKTFYKEEPVERKKKFVFPSEY